MNTKQSRMTAKQVPRKNKQVMSKEDLRKYLEAMFHTDKQLISRRDPQLNEIVAWGTLANADSEGDGIQERVIIGNKTFYARMATIDWLVDRAKE